MLATQAAMSAVASSVPVLMAGALSDLIGVTPVMALVAAAIGMAALANVRPRAIARRCRAGSSLVTLIDALIRPLLSSK